MKKKSIQHTYSGEQLAFISKNRTMFRAELAEAFNKKFGTEQTTEAIKKICTRRDWPSGRKGFQKGHTPWHKGTKGLIRAKETSFKKGDINPRHRPIGSERIKGGHVIVKIGDPNIWKRKHILIWEAAHGPLPPDKLVIFKDGNFRNFSLDNLELVSKPLLLRLNQHRYFEIHGDLKPSLMAVAKVECKVFALANGG